MKSKSEIFRTLLELVEERSFNWKVEDEFNKLNFSLSQRDASNFPFKNNDLSLTGELYFSSTGRLVRCAVKPTKEIYKEWKDLAKALPDYSKLPVGGILDNPSKFTRITLNSNIFIGRVVSFHISDLVAY
jgi:hypothetical protein